MDGSVGLRFLCEEIVFIILDKLDENPSNIKSFSEVCKSFYAIESRHRKFLKPGSQKHLARILRRYSRISHLDLSSVKGINDASFDAVSNHLSSVKGIINASFDAVSNHCKETLKSINLSESLFPMKGLKNVIVSCKNLVDIELSGYCITDSSLIEVAKVKNLERLWLVNCLLITDVGINYIAEGCRKLRLLSLARTRVSDLGVGLIVAKCKELRSLDLTFLKITKKCLPQILELQYLEDLVLEFCSFDKENLAAPKLGSKSLKRLNISCLDNSSTDLLLFNNLQSLPTLQSINLSGCEVTCSGLNAIGNWCGSLKELSLVGCNGVTDEGLSPIFRKHKDLQKLAVSLCNKITCASVVHLTTSCASLVSLKMGRCTQLSARAFVLIGQHCQFLEELNVSHGNIDNEGLKSLSRCPWLSSIELEFCSYITDKGLEHIATSCSKLKEINLCGSDKITISGMLAVIRGCPSLKVMDIDHSPSIREAIRRCNKVIKTISRTISFRVLLLPPIL